MSHDFVGKWITSEEFCDLEPRCVFFRQLERRELDCSEHRNRHVLFRRSFCIDGPFESARLFISADDYYKLYVNGRFVAQGPAPSYHFRYNYNEIDLSGYLRKGENLIAVHTLYQGLVNRVWQSADNRHGMICDLVVDGQTHLSSGEDFLVRVHSGYTETGVCGYKTQFLERYDSRAGEVGFEQEDYDDSGWAAACVCRHDDHVLTEQKSRMLELEEIAPKEIKRGRGRVLYDFGSNYVGYLKVAAHGGSGDEIIIRCAQELSEDSSPRYRLRANCVYEETWVLSSGRCELDQFDYKAFRYAELIFPESVRIEEASLVARHYPFSLATGMKAEYMGDEELRSVWELCVNTQKYGVQEAVLDCMEREKGFYLGDGCYTAMTNMVLTCDDSMVRKLIDDAFASSFITDTLVTCMNCSFMQEIAEYPLILVDLVLWHYRFTGDVDYLAKNYPKVTALLEAYRREYESDGLLKELDKWCVVEWPKEYRHGYDLAVREGEVCHTAHVSINAYYVEAVRSANKMARALGICEYREEAPLLDSFYRAFYDPERGLFKDSEETDHVSLVGNSFAYGFDLCPSRKSRERILAMFDECGIASLSLFCTFPMLKGLVLDGDGARLRASLLNAGAWRRMLREGATTTFEVWGKDGKWNTSLFHLTMSYAALFLADVDQRAIFE